jgi:hypothetical protein
MKQQRSLRVSFALIEEIIVRLFRQSDAPVTHAAIAEALVVDQAGRQILRERQASLSRERTLEWLASNEVARFSARISRGEFSIDGRFVRSRAGGTYAYAPVRPPAPTPRRRKAWVM